MLEPAVKSATRTVISWTRKATIQVRDSVSDVDWSRFNITLTRARVSLADNLSALGSSIRSRLGR
jgi:hypothetical protein